MSIPASICRTPIGARQSVGGGGNFADRSFNSRIGKRQPNSQFFLQFDFGNQSVRDIRFKSKRGRIFKLQEWFARSSQIAHVGAFGGDDSVERRCHRCIAEHRLSFGDGGIRHPKAGLRGVEFLLSDSVLFEEHFKALDVFQGLLPEGLSLIQSCLYFAGIQLNEQFARLHPLAGGNKHLLNHAADF